MKPRIIEIGSPDYPSRFRRLSDPPRRLWVAGAFEISPMVAIVGSRRADTRMLRIASDLAGGLASLATGQFFSIRARTPQLRWRFRASASFASSLGVMGSAILAAGVVIQLGPAWIFATIALYAASLWHCGQTLHK